MKRNISDMLDHLQVPDLPLAEDSPLSSRRIRRITMGKINGTTKRRPALSAKVLIAVAIIASLTLTALAADKLLGAGDWFREGMELDEGQVELVNTLGESFQPQTYTDQGTTIEAKAAYADAHVMYLYLSVTAPEGTVLPDGILYDFVDRNATGPTADGSRPNHLGGNAPYTALYNFMNVQALKDEDPGDNKKDFVVMLITQLSQETRFNDGYAKFLPITGIYEQEVNVDGDHDAYTLLAPGSFRIDITLNQPMDQVALDVEGLRYGGVKTKTWTHDGPCGPGCDGVLTGQTDPESGRPVHAEQYEYEVTLRTMTVSNMCVTWENGYTCDDADKMMGAGFQVVMKDGSIVPITPNGSSYRALDGEFTGVAYFQAPIDLADVAYIQIGDKELGQVYSYSLPGR